MIERTAMNAMNANTEGAYLRDVGERLRALTPEQRDAVLDDVRAHFADAADAGRTPEQAAEGLGDCPRSIPGCSSSPSGRPVGCSSPSARATPSCTPGRASRHARSSGATRERGHTIVLCHGTADTAIR